MPRTIDVQSGKTLKLTNVIMTKVEKNNFMDMQIKHEQMINYARQNGVMPVGPIMQKSVYGMNENLEPEVSIYLLQQLTGFIHQPQSPYMSEAMIRVPNCLYARYSGNGDNLRFAYDKIDLVAYEQEIELGNENYTVFVDEMEEEIVIDIFVEQTNCDEKYKSFSRIKEQQVAL